MVDNLRLEKRNIPPQVSSTKFGTTQRHQYPSARVSNIRQRVVEGTRAGETEGTNVDPDKLNMTKSSKLALLLHVPAWIFEFSTEAAKKKKEKTYQMFFKIEAKGVTPIPVPIRTATSEKTV